MTTIIFSLLFFLFSVNIIFCETMADKFRSTNDDAQASYFERMRNLNVVFALMSFSFILFGLFTMEQL